MARYLILSLILFRIKDSLKSCMRHSIIRDDLHVCEMCVKGEGVGVIMAMVFEQVATPNFISHSSSHVAHRHQESLSLDIFYKSPSLRSMEVLIVLVTVLKDLKT